MILQHGRIAAAMLCAAVGCASPGATGPSDSFAGTDIPVNAVDVSAEQVLSRPVSGISDSRRIVIRSDSEWTEFWAAANANLVPPPEAPEVDFSRDMILAAAMGGRPTGGYAISIPTVKREGSEVWAVVHERSPGPTCFTTQVLTAPVVAVRVPRLEGPLHWIEDESRTEC